MKKYSFKIKFNEWHAFEGIVQHEKTIKMEATNDKDVIIMFKAILEAYKNKKVQLIKATIFKKDFTNEFKIALDI